MGNNRLFIAGLSETTTTETFREVFSEFGPIVEAQIITDRETGMSKGFGFLTFENVEDAQRAIQQMNGSPLDGKNIHVAESKKRADKHRLSDRSSWESDNGTGGLRFPKRPKRGFDRW